MALVEFQSITRCLKWWIMFFCFLFLSSLCFVLFLSLSVHGDQLKIGIKKSLRVPITRDPVKDEKEEIKDICSCCCCFLGIREVLKTVEHTFERLWNIFIWEGVGTSNFTTTTGHFFHYIENGFLVDHYYVITTSKMAF